MSNNDRLEHIRNYFANQKVTVEIPAAISETTKGKKIYRFSGRRLGYDFKNGFAVVDRKDLHLFRENFPNIVIHEQGEKGHDHR